MKPNLSNPTKNLIHKKLKEPRWKTIIDGIRFRLHWIERKRYTLEDKDLDKLEEIWNMLSEMDNDLEERLR